MIFPLCNFHFALFSRNQKGFTPLEMIRSAEGDGNTFKRHFLSPTGFTLVELMIAVLIGSFLAFTVGMILINAQTHWTEGSRKLGLQRDASIAMYRMERAIQGGNGATSSSGDLTINYSTEGWKKFFLEGDSSPKSLKYKEQDWEGSETIIDGKVDGLTFDVSGKIVKVDLTLKKDNLEANFVTSATCRN